MIPIGIRKFMKEDASSLNLVTEMLQVITLIK